MPGASARDQPNVALFVTDDHGRWAAGCYGNPEVRTPTLDQLASTGVRYDHAFTPTPVCSPARASLATGLMASQHGIHDHLREQEPGVGERDWLAGRRTLAEHFAAAGYRCLFVGKWHMGRSSQPQRGYHRWFSIARTGPHSGRERYFEDGRPAEITGFKAEVFTEQALRWLREPRDGRPFFLQVCHTSTHSPWRGHPERLAADYRSAGLTLPSTEIPTQSDGGPLRPDMRPEEVLAQYYAAATLVDESIGRLLDEIEAQGERERTLVVYTADHGLALGQHGVWGKGNGTAPKNMYEASIRVPLIWNHPGALPAGCVEERFVTHCDLFCSLLDYAGIDAWRTDARLAGHSYVPALRGGAQPWEDVYFGEYGPLRCVRTRSRKLVRRYGHGRDELWDLAADPGECNNLIASPGHRAEGNALSALLEAFFREHEDPRRSGLLFDPDSRGVGPEHLVPAGS